MVEIKNNLVRVLISEKAAEIHSFYDLQNKIEFMWQGDEAYWSGRNPILFPIVGNTFNKIYKLDEKTYSFDNNHGFVRNSMFNVIDKGKDFIILGLDENENTLRQYPFKFNLQVIYQLNGKRLTITYTVKNKNKADMPFNFGMHPAFNVPFGFNESFMDYKIIFSNNENQINLLGPYHLKGKECFLNYDIFKENETLCFEYLKSSYVKLTNGINAVKMGITGYRWFAIWTKINAPFICLEPWHSHGDFKEGDNDFYSREGTIILEKDKSYTTSYYIEIE